MSSLARRTVTSVSWSVVANASMVVILVVRSILLARLLPVEVFGLYTGAGSIVGLSSILAGFGFISAFVHRSPETEDEGKAAAVYFTLQLLFTSSWAILVATGAWWWAPPAFRWPILVLILTTGLTQLTDIPQAILMRRVVHRRLASLRIVMAVLTTAVAISLAWAGYGLAALLATDVVTALNIFIGLYIWRPVWRPRLSWQPAIVRYFLRFGSRNLLAYILEVCLQRFDNLWVVTYQGATALGYYSRAYTFATYPRQILAAPVAIVTTGAYAEVTEDRRRLSQAFVQTNTLLARGGFLIGGLLFLVAPEFIRLVLGAKWLPMLMAFRLMLLFVLLDPIRDIVASLFIATGKLRTLTLIRFGQVLVQLTGFFTLGMLLGITGVAISMGLMALVGVVALLYTARRVVDFSLTELFLAPTVALVGGLALARLAILLPGVLGSDWRTGAVKSVVFVLIYGLTLLVLERRQIMALFALVQQQFLKGKHA